MQVPRALVVSTILLSLVVGAGAGIISSILTSRALDDYATSLLGARGFTPFEPRKPNTNPGNYDDVIERIREQENRSVVLITAKSTVSEAPVDWLTSEDIEGRGVVVGANGWILTSQDELAAFANPLTQATVWVRHEPYVIAQVIEDSLTPLVLLRLSDATGMSAVAFANSEEMRSGDMVFLALGEGEVLATAIEDSEKVVSTAPQHAEVFPRSWAVPPSTLGNGPLFAASGALAAFKIGDREAVPMHHASAFVQEVIRLGAPAHALLGAYVVDIAHVINMDPALRQNQTTGALVIAPSAAVRAVPVTSPAGVAELAVGDIITEVNGEAITSTTSLAELLATYDPQQTARLSVVRGGTTIEISVIFGDESALVY